MNEALAVVLKATLVLAVAGLSVTLLARAAASIRHLVWMSAIAIVLLLPAAVLLSPDWTPVKKVVTVQATTPRIVVDVVAGVKGSAPSLSSFLLGLWLAGAGFVAARLWASYRGAARLAARADGFLDDGRVRISGEIAIPVVCGLRRPVIVLPEAARQWPAERLRVVLAHESMHVRRKDLLWQAVAQCACVLLLVSSARLVGGVATAAGVRAGMRRRSSCAR